MAFIKENTVDEILLRASIVTTISEYTKLTKVGNRYRGLCPFHPEKNPSFYVSDEKNIFKCFGCNEGGNVINFIMKKESLTFPEAIIKLGQKFGISVVTEEKNSKTKSQTARMYEINRIALKYFKNNLNESVINYLKQRGLNREAIDKFEIGYAPESWSGMLLHLKKNGVSTDEAQKIGLIVKGQKEGSIYDRFRNRVIFPIHNIMDEISGFGGRVLDDSQPKYLNSSESPIYQKSKLLYGLPFAKNFIKKNGFVIITEGYFDFITLFLAGFQNVCSLSGTALTEEHLRLLKKYTDTVVLLLDSDIAGIKAMARSFSLFLKSDIEAKVVILPEGYDPDSFLRKHTRENFESYLREAKSLLDFYVNFHLKKDNSISAKSELVKSILLELSNLDDSLKRELVFLKLSDLLGISVKIINEQFSRINTTTKNENIPATKFCTTNLPKEEKLLFKTALNNPSLFEKFTSCGVLEKISSTELKDLWPYVEKTQEKSGKYVIQKIFSYDLPSPISNLVSELLIDDKEIREESSQKIFDDCVEKINKNLRKNKEREFLSEIRQAEKTGNKELVIQLLKEKNIRIHS